MARTWLAIRVELLGGRGQELWPRPGRTFAVGPAHTFGTLARAIDEAFARWDRAHLCQFTLADGTVVTDEESGEELAESPFGPLGRSPLVLDRTKVAARVGLGDEFSYVFDFGDGWTHACTVEAEKVDPGEVLGASPKVPVAFWGWGTLPDQYGRRWADDTGEGPVPPRPGATHPMLFGSWPEAAPEPVDLAALRRAMHSRDVGGILAELEGKDVDDVLQRVGEAAQIALRAEPDRAEAVAVSVMNRLSERGAAGDQVLAEDLLALLRGVPIAARRLPIDLVEVAGELEGDAGLSAGYLDLHTGEVLPAVLTDPAEVGEDAYVDVDAEPDRWLALERLGSRSGWQDMASFAASQTRPGTRARLESAIAGRGAFRRFRDVVAEEGLLDGWHRYADERAIGRAREYLADRGVRVET